LALLLNKVLQKILPAFIFGGILAGAVALAACVKLSWTSLNTVPLGVCFMVFVDCLGLQIILLGGMVGVYLESLQVFKVLK